MVETRPSDLSNKYDKNENITWKYCLIIDYFLPSDRWSDKNSWIEVGQLFPLKGKGVWNKWIFTIHMYLLSRKRQYSCPRQQTCHYFTILILYYTLFSFLQLVYFELSVSLLWFQIHCNLPHKSNVWRISFNIFRLNLESTSTAITFNFTVSIFTFISW